MWVIISASVMADLAKHSVTPLTARNRMRRHWEKKWSPRESKESYLGSQQIRAGALSQIVSTVQM